MMSGKETAKTEITAQQFPALWAFLRGYFHQDMKDEYGSLEAATRQFCEDADSAERKAVEKEWERFVEQTSTEPLSVVNQLITRNLGSACTFASPEELKKISDVFRNCRGASG